MKNKLLLENLANYAKSVYSSCLNTATADDFANPKLHQLHQKVICKTSKYINKPLKRIQHFAYVAALIFNNERLYNPDLCFKTNFLAYIVYNKVYSVKKIKELFDTKRYRYWIVPGMDYSLPDQIEKQIMEGINVTNS